jgi:hypothetical protein
MQHSRQKIGEKVRLLSKAFVELVALRRHLATDSRAAHNLITAD